MNEPRPNILLFVADDQRHDTIGGVNNAQISTPNLRYLARRGTMFDNAYLMGSCHPAVCMPSRAMAHTGRSLFHITGDGDTIAEEHHLLGEHLSRSGYVSAGVGKWHNGPRSFARSFRAGGPVFFGGMDDQWNMPVCDVREDGNYPQPVERAWDPGTGERSTEPRILDRTSDGVHATELFAGAAAEFIRTCDGDSPFFLSVAFTAPHDPRTMPQRFQSLYDPVAIELGANVIPAHPFDNGEMAVRDECLDPAPCTRETWQRHTADYYGMISHMDEQVGVVIDALKARGMLDSTIIVYTADHGISIGRHGLMGKQNLYDHSIHVPLLISGPGIPADERRDTFCYLFDLFPTLCELTGVAIPPTVEGLSLVPVLDDPDHRHRERLFVAYSAVQRTIFDSEYKLIEYLVEGQRTTQLFDRIRDPDELCNLAETPHGQPAVARLRGELLSAMRRSDDRYLAMWEPVLASS